MKIILKPIIHLFLIYIAVIFASIKCIGQTTVTFNCTGAAQNWVVPPCVTSISVTVEGAQGGGSAGGLGAIVTGTLAVTPGQTLQINVGCTGACPGTGFNGGGAGQSATGAGNASCGGGGASDIRISPYGLGNSLIVAGGGGGTGGGDTDGLGGDGGCTLGVVGGAPFGQGGGAGTQTAGGTGGPPWISSGNAGASGSLGVGGAGGTDPCYNLGPGGGGGGGYYGGGGGGSDCYGSAPLGGGGGGGGSSLMPIGGGCTAGTNTGAGVVSIIYTSSVITVTVNSPTICAGQTATLTAGGGTTYSWSTGATTNPINVTPATTTSYTVTGTTGGCSGTAIATVTVNPQPTLAVAGIAATCNGTCDGQTIVIPSGGISPYTYLWSSGCTVPACNSLCAGPYTLTVTDALGCTATGNATVSEPTAISLVMSFTTAHCNQPDGSASVVTSGGTPGYSYLWAPGGQTTSTAVNLIPGSYCVTVTDANGCTMNTCITVPNAPGIIATVTSSSQTSCNGICDGTATVSAVSGIAPYTYLWTNGQTTPIASGLCVGSFTCTVTDSSGCTDTASITIIQPTPVMIDVIAPVTICIGQTITLTAVAQGGNAGGYTYNWTTPTFTGNPYTVSPGTTTVYSVIATDPMGCVSVNTQTVTVTVRPPLAVNASNNVAICPGGNTTLTCIASGGDNTYSYNWMPGAGNASSFNVSPSVTTTYTLTLTDACTTLPAMDMVTITVLPLPNVTFSSNVNFGCAPLCVNFLDLSTITGANIISWSWAFGGAGVASIQSPPNCFNSAGVYNVTLTVTSDSGCVNTFTINNMITVIAMPEANFAFGPQPALISEPTISFNDQSTNATAWIWDFGDTASLNNTSLLSNPSHFYSDTGSYCVTMIVTNTITCADTVTNCLMITPEFTFYIPNAFTPNGDGMNDVFQPKGEFIKEFTMRIFDRWGNLTYMTQDLYKGWNGKMKNVGEIVQQDVYVYIINIKDRLGQKHQYIGHVTIIK